jgi:hypothetical protein
MKRKKGFFSSQEKGLANGIDLFEDYPIICSTFAADDDSLFTHRKTRRCVLDFQPGTMSRIHANWSMKRQVSSNILAVYGLNKLSGQTSM